MKVLITGGMGVIGSEAARKFVQEGIRPVIYARHRDDSLIGDIKDRIDIELGDILDMPRLLETIKKHGITHIVHAAAFVGAVSQQNPALSIQVNVMGMVNVLEAARLFEIKRLVYTSAKGVYGPVGGEHGHPTFKPLPEDHPKNPVRIYDSAKLMGEYTGLYYQKNMGIDIAILRFSTTYGPGKTARHGNLGVTSQLIETVAAGRPFRLAQGGDKRDDFIYVKDCALGIYLACMAADLKSRVYNIGTGVGLTLQDFARVLRRHFPRADIDIGPGFTPSNIYDLTRARQELGYSPQFDLERGIADYLGRLSR
jgi:UDP-glucose 4-epimerase